MRASLRRTTGRTNGRLDGAWSEAAARRQIRKRGRSSTGFESRDRIGDEPFLTRDQEPELELGLGCLRVVVRSHLGTTPYHWSIAKGRLPKGRSGRRAGSCSAPTSPVGPSTPVLTGQGADRATISTFARCVRPRARPSPASQSAKGPTDADDATAGGRLAVPKPGGAVCQGSSWLLLLPRSDSAAAHGRAQHRAVADRPLRQFRELAAASVLQGVLQQRPSLASLALIETSVRRQELAPSRCPALASSIQRGGRGQLTSSKRQPVGLSLAWEEEASRW